MKFILKKDYCPFKEGEEVQMIDDAYIILKMEDGQSYSVPNGLLEFKKEEKDQVKTNSLISVHQEMKTLNIEFK
ncbi:hypothetical protein phi1422_0021 [Bdellovibrio phage phi1422]|uniref:hypothetical protein n=1 Tax=Bdellovibrio phage phi1422 TaxID=1127515 RepID=UPI0002536D49|nr:hypothetical protein F395_gp21 [Bdellovibrio phage phi1422]AFC22541.1 hypothetical protein phi1422_0021 [Bdellovibrio phage phi1422]